MLYFVTILCLVVFAFGQNSEVSFKGAVTKLLDKTHSVSLFHK